MNFLCLFLFLGCAGLLFYGLKGLCLLMLVPLVFALPYFTQEILKFFKKSKGENDENPTSR